MSLLQSNQHSTLAFVSEGAYSLAVADNTEKNDTTTGALSTLGSPGASTTAHTALVGDGGSDEPLLYRTFYTSVGMGIDSDVTSASKKAVREAIDRVQLRHMSVSTNLYWFVRLGVPSSLFETNGSIGPVDLGKVASELPMNATLLPLEVVLGGLSLEGNSIAVVASVSLQEHLGDKQRRSSADSPVPQISTNILPKPISRSKSIDILAHAVEMHEKEPHRAGLSSDDDETGSSSYWKDPKIKKLPPGTTPKNNKRLFVKHEYTDMSSERPLPGEEHLGGTLWRPRTLNGAFPLKLHEILTEIEKDGYSDIIGWLPHGRSFKIFDHDRFCEIVLPNYFVMTKKSSFLRQLNLYGFNRLSSLGPDQGSYYHEKFLRGRKYLCSRMTRQKVNGNGIRAAGNPDQEPKLCLFPVCAVSKEESDYVNQNSKS